MNLVDIYTLSYFKEGTPVVVIHDFKHNQDIKKTTRGKIVKVDNKEKTLSVFFENGVWSNNVKPTFIRPANDMTYLEALDVINAHIGHHCNHGNTLQFDIKMRKSLNAPSEVELLLNNNLINEVICEFVETTLSSFVDEKEFDFCPLSFFDRFDGYWTAGRSGGYLILEERYRTLDSFYCAEDNLKDATEYHKDDKENLELYTKEYEESKEDLLEFAYDILMIEKLIKDYQDHIYNYVSDLEFWRNYLDNLIY